MKRIKNIKNFELGLILTILAIGILLPWHSPLLGGKSSSNTTLSDYEEVEEGLLAKQTTIPQLEEKETDNSPGGSALDVSPSITQGNTIISLSQTPEEEEKETKKMKMVITAYSSTVDQTDSTPYTTASGVKVKSGIVANNALAFGTEIKIPELYGDRIFVVEDRLHRRKGNYHLDIWFPTEEQALEFGSKTVTIQVVN